MDRTPNLPAGIIRTDTWEMIERLIAFDTTSRESNLGLIEWVRDWLKQQGIDTRLTYDVTGKKANLFATIEPQGAGATRAGIVLSGHTDVVPVDGQAWDTDPFKAIIKDDRIYARGSADMKSYLAVALTMTPRFLAAKMKAPVHFALSYDEEVGCIGVRGLIEDLARNNIKPAGCIVGEPTSMEVVIAHKGKRAFRCCVTGREAHSALTPKGVNAIEYAARLIVYVRHMADRMRDTETRDYGFDVPFTTMQTGTIRGGTATNIVPRECIFDFEYRYLPGADPDALEREIRDYAARLALEMQGVDPQTRMDIAVQSDAPGLNMEETDQLTYLTKALNRGSSISKVAYATEAGLFQAAGIPSIICGPGSIGEAHRPNEFIALEQVAQCEAFMDRLVVELEK